MCKNDQLSNLKSESTVERKKKIIHFCNLIKLEFTGYFLYAMELNKILKKEPAKFRQIRIFGRQKH